MFSIIKIQWWGQRSINVEIERHLLINACNKKCGPHNITHKNKYMFEYFAKQPLVIFFCHFKKVYQPRAMYGTTSSDVHSVPMNDGLLKKICTSEIVFM